jgi:hypothetical protein
LNIPQLPDLSQCLHDRDLGHLQIVADAWGIDFSAPDQRSGLQRLALLLLDARLLNNVIQDLSEDARQAFTDLIRNEGRLPWPLFIRRYGALREMGRARRDRELPHLKPISATEMLWYRSLIGRSFFDTPAGPEEFAYIPKDLMALAPEVETSPPQMLGHATMPADLVTPIKANDHILDHTCTFLAALRVGIPLEDAFAGALVEWCYGIASPDSCLNFLRQVLSAAGLLDHAGIPKPEPTRSFLEQNRGDALAGLAKAWLDSTQINELRLVPGLTFEGKWQNDPGRIRRLVVDFISSAPGQHRISSNSQQAESDSADSRASDRIFVNLNSFIQAVRQYHPDFQRPAGDYDTWFIRDSKTGDFLRGFDHWDQVDGALLNFIICGPLFWLGMVDLAESEVSSPGARKKVNAFRFSSYAQQLLVGQAPVGFETEQGRWHVNSDGHIAVPRLSSRATRYQIARFCAWDGFDVDLYHYHLTPYSLERAHEQGLRVSHLLRLLRSQVKVLSPKLVRALERWEEQGSEAHFEKAVILRLKNPEILQELRTGRAAKFLGDPLGPTAIIVRPGAVDAVKDALLEMGLLSKVIFDS